MSMPSQPGRERQPIEVALFVTCLVDLFRPSAAFAAVKLLEEAGCHVAVPPSQTCCGQPAYNSGDRKAAKEIAEQVIAAFERYPYIVVPRAPAPACSASTIRGYSIPKSSHPGMQERPHSQARLRAYVVPIGYTSRRFTGRAYPRRVTFHDSCSSFREMGVADPAAEAFASLDGIAFVEMELRGAAASAARSRSNIPDISNAMVSQKVDRIAETKADVLTGADLGSLVNIAGERAGGRSRGSAARRGNLAGELDEPGYGRRNSSRKIKLRLR